MSDEDQNRIIIRDAKMARFTDPFTPFCSNGSSIPESYYAYFTFEDVPDMVDEQFLAGSLAEDGIYRARSRFQPKITIQAEPHIVSRASGGYELINDGHTQNKLYSEYLRLMKLSEIAKMRRTANQMFVGVSATLVLDVFQYSNPVKKGTGLSWREIIIPDDMLDQIASNVLKGSDYE